MPRRLLRFALHALTVLSALLCIAASMLWVRSYWVGDYVRYHRDRADHRRSVTVLWRARSERCGLSVFAITVPVPFPSPPSLFSTASPDRPQQHRRPLLDLLPKCNLVEDKVLRIVDDE